MDYPFIWEQDHCSKFSRFELWIPSKRELVYRWIFKSTFSSVMYLNSQKSIKKCIGSSSVNSSLMMKSVKFRRDSRVVEVHWIKWLQIHRIMGFKSWRYCNLRLPALPEILVLNNLPCLSENTTYMKRHQIIMQNTSNSFWCSSVIPRHKQAAFRSLRLEIKYS